MPPPEEIQLPHHVGGRTHKGPAKLAVANYGYGTTLPTTRGSSCSKRPDGLDLLERWVGVGAGQAGRGGEAGRGLACGSRSGTDTGAVCAVITL